MMREVTAFQVIFAKNPPVFSPSEIIQGTIQLGISAAIAFQNIQVHLFGRSFSKIVESNTSNFDDEYKGSETYLDKKIMVWGDGKYHKCQLYMFTFIYRWLLEKPLLFSCLFVL